MPKVKYIKEKQYRVFDKTLFKTREEYEEVSTDDEVKTPIFFVLGVESNN